MQFRQLREWFIFSSKERNGILILLVVLVLVTTSDLIMPKLFPPKTPDLTAWTKEAESIVDSSGAVKPVQISALFVGTADPNQVSREELIAMGVPVALAERWIKYLSKGGNFRQKQDVLKLFGMSQQLYDKIALHLQVPEPKIPVQVRKPTRQLASLAAPITFRKDSVKSSFIKKERNVAVVELNAADSVMMESLPGIGPVLAVRVLKYRRLLGGFYNTNQLKEIYGMSAELWAKASPYLKADASSIQKLPINFLTVSELGKHPYVGYRQAKRLVRARDQAGKFVSLLSLSPLFTPDSLNRLAPYLSFEGIAQ